MHRQAVRDWLAGGGRKTTGPSRFVPAVHVKQIKRGSGSPLPLKLLIKSFFMTENVGAAIGRPQCESYVFAGIWRKNLCFTAGRAMLAPTVTVEKIFDTLRGSGLPLPLFYKITGDGIGQKQRQTAWFFPCVCLYSWGVNAACEAASEANPYRPQTGRQ